MTSTLARPVRVRAYAKINLNLRILRRREDGYHDLRTVFQVLALHDTLTFTPRPGPFAIECDDGRLAVDSTNLVWRAADLLWQYLERDGQLRDVAVRIDKRIPLKAGLGGGSSDAAAALIGLARLWRPHLPAEILAPLGASLGADVRFFFTGGAALGLGRGDELRPLSDLPPLGVLLVYPAFDVSTADAYRWWDEAHPGTPERTESVPHCSWGAPDCEIVNDFEPVIGARHPELRDAVRAVRDAGARAAAMTGSGSTVFGLFDDDDEVVRAERTLATAGFAVATTRTMTRSAYRASSAPACL